MGMRAEPVVAKQGRCLGFDRNDVYTIMYISIMSTKTTLPISEVRKRLFSITDAVQTPGVAYTLTENGRPKAVILSAAEFESMLETLEVLHEYPGIKRQMAEVRRDIASGKIKDYLPLGDFLQSQGYGIQARPKTKRRQGTGRALR